MRYGRLQAILMQVKIYAGTYFYQRGFLMGDVLKNRASPEDTRTPLDEEGRDPKGDLRGAEDRCTDRLLPSRTDEGVRKEDARGEFAATELGLELYKATLNESLSAPNAPKRRQIPYAFFSRMSSTPKHFLLLSLAIGAAVLPYHIQKSMQCRSRLFSKRPFNCGDEKN